MQGGVGNRLIELELGQGVTVAATDSPFSPLLPVFFEGYNRAFILPDEREELDGFQACLALNATHRHAYGRTHSEIVAVFRDEHGEVLGGANFLATALTGRPVPPLASIALNYVYVEDAARGRGMLRVMLRAVRQLALVVLDLDPAGPSPAIFIEQNDPLRLSEEEYRADTEHSGTDQLDRLAIWSRVGTRIVDFAYIQPALSEEQQPDDGLILGAVGYDGDAVDPGLLHGHLESFFGISVLKGRPEQPGGVAAAQLAALAKRTGDIQLLSMEPAIAWLRSGQSVGSADSFRALAEAAAVKE